MAPALALLSVLAAVVPLAPAARIVAEWEPGVTGAELGGPLVVDTYGVEGLGAYQVRLDDGTTVLAVCIQADVGHSLGAEYAVDATVALGAELGYLAWAYLRPGSAPSDVQAAAVNALAWRFSDAQRRTGGPVWQGDELEIRVLGVGRLTAVEQAVATLHAEAIARRGPWTLSDAVVTPDAVAVRLAGPGGPIAGVEVHVAGDGGWLATAVTDAGGIATVAVAPGTAAVEVTAEGPGPALALVAPGSQRLATPGPSVVVATALVVPTTTTTVPAATAPPATTAAPTTTVTTTSTPTTVAPPTIAPPTIGAPPTTVAPSTTATTTTTTTPATTSPPLPTTTTPAAPPPSLPRTGPSSRGVGRLAACLFAVGALAVLLATPRRVTGGPGAR